MPTTKKKTSTKKSPLASFEASLHDLEKLVNEMEHGNLSLEESLNHFEQGVKLTATCQKALTEAEQKVEVLQKKAAKSLRKLEQDGLFEEE